MEHKDGVYKAALTDKKIPILTLDNKWHRLFTQTEPTPAISRLEQRLNELLKRQGKLNTETKEIKKLKKKLMDEIVSVRDEMEQGQSNALEKKVEDNKRLLAECNEKLEGCQDELMELPREIEKTNQELMLLTMEICYDKLQANTEEIQETAAWVAQIRVELKKRLVRKQEKEIQNHELYSYMHDIFGADVIEIFDLKYNPEEHRPKPSLKNSRKDSGKEEKEQEKNAQ